MSELADIRVKYPCPVCNKDELIHDDEINCFHCSSCNYQWHPSNDYSDSKRFITNIHYERNEKSFCMFPNLTEIVDKCRTKIRKKYDEYGNSWVGETDWDFWRMRLSGEIKEIWASGNMEKRQNEIIDAINILAMMYENCKLYLSNIQNVNEEK
jgi:RNA processing factor Prp31